MGKGDKTKLYLIRSFSVRKVIHWHSGAQLFGLVGQRSSAGLGHRLNHTLHARIRPSHLDWALHGLVWPPSARIWALGPCSASARPPHARIGVQRQCAAPHAVPHASIRFLGPVLHPPNPTCQDRVPMLWNEVSLSDF